MNLQLDPNLLSAFIRSLSFCVSGSAKWHHGLCSAPLKACIRPLSRSLLVSLPIYSSPSMAQCPDTVVKITGLFHGTVRGEEAGSTVEEAGREQRAAALCQLLASPQLRWMQSSQRRALISHTHCDCLHGSVAEAEH